MRSSGSRERRSGCRLWNEVDAYATDRESARSRPPAAADGREARLSPPQAVPRQPPSGNPGRPRPAIPASAGIVVVHGSWVTSMDLFGRDSQPWLVSLKLANDAHPLLISWTDTFRRQGQPVSHSMVLDSCPTASLYAPARQAPGRRAGRYEHRISDHRLYRTRS